MYVQRRLLLLECMYVLPAPQGVLHAVLDKVVSRVETLISRKSFNQLGGLQLDRDIRALVCVAEPFYFISNTSILKHFFCLGLAILTGHPGPDDGCDWMDSAMLMTLVHATNR